MPDPVNPAAAPKRYTWSREFDRRTARNVFYVYDPNGRWIVSVTYARQAAHRCQKLNAALDARRRNPLTTADRKRSL
jgi:hypothetical protein